jgi:phosphoenolpyruvate synthase/pyruvate phosphate dikinase
LLETISIFYNIPIIGENINDLNNMLVNPSNLIYKEALAHNETIKDSVIRYHPLQLLERPYVEINSDLNLFNFKQYDKIYFTFRNPVDAIASEFVAETVNRWTYKSKEDLINIKPISLNEDYHKVIKEHIYSERLVKKIKEYFIINDIKSIDIFYEDIPQYLIDNFPGANTFHIETNYDYRKILSNYNDILTLYNHYTTIL